MESYSKIISFESIPASPDPKLVLARLGFQKNRTEIDSVSQDKLERGLKDGLILCRSKGAAGRFRITEHREDSVAIETGLSFHSSRLARFLENCGEVVLLAVTVGTEIVDRIAREVNHGDAAYGVILDAVASETADAGLDWIMNFYKKILYREGKKLTKHRYSPGYGDLDLAYQREIFKLLNLEKLGLDLTEKQMLVPEKSVLAIAGIERIEANGSSEF
ncbi:MAG: methionine synthase [Firmicutes bacterium]|nr:methionine synthase [Bacillota bacterium]